MLGTNILHFYLYRLYGYTTYRYNVLYRTTKFRPNLSHTRTAFVYNTLQDIHTYTLGCRLKIRGGAGETVSRNLFGSGWNSQRGWIRPKGALGFSPRGPVVAPNSLYTHIYIHYI